MSQPTQEPEKHASDSEYKQLVDDGLKQHIEHNKPLSELESHFKEKRMSDEQISKAIDYIKHETAEYHRKKGEPNPDSSSSNASSGKHHYGWVIFIILSLGIGLFLFGKARGWFG